jgi:hypothetical protein
MPIGLAMAAAYILFPGLSMSARSWGWLPTLTLFPVGEPALSVAWTLQHEIVFYAVIWLLFSLRKLFWGFFLWAAAILLIHQSKPLEMINLEFLFGVCAAWAFMREKWRYDLALGAIGSSSSSSSSPCARTTIAWCSGSVWRSCFCRSFAWKSMAG